jgi:prolyl oligopeptidase
MFRMHSTPSSFFFRGSAVLLALLVSASGLNCGSPQATGEAPIALPGVSTIAPTTPGIATTAVATSRPGVLVPTRRDSTVDKLHGTDVADPYRWLEDASTEETKRWTESQNALARAELAKLPERSAIAKRLTEVYYVDAEGAPMHRGKYYFTSKKSRTDEKAIIYVREGKTGSDTAILNPNEWSSDGSASLGNYSPSHDGKLLAYSVKKNNSDEATLYLYDVVNKKKLESDVIAGAKYATASWTPKGDGFYYVWLPTDPAIKPADRPGYAEVRFHKIGSDPKTDAVVREKTSDPTTFLHGWLSYDGRFLFHELAHGWASAEVFYKDLSKKNAPWVAIAPGQKAHYDVDAYKGKLYITTDEGAPRQRVFVMDPQKPERTNWKEILPEPKDESIRSVAVRGGKLAITYLRNATSRLELRELDGSKPVTVELPGLGSIGGLVGLEDEDVFYVSYTTYTDPASTFEVSAKSSKLSLYRRIEVPFDRAAFTTQQFFFPSKDGTKVSMFVTRRNDVKPTRDTRVMLYGYGGFLHAETPAFNATIIPWLERGGIYVTVNLRGGSEYGETWHQGGMLLNKQNTFDDFIASAEFLVREGMTSPSHIAIAGGSNGGLLVGAAMTQRPDLFGAVLCAVPLLDMVRYHQFGSGRTWIAEYGSSENEKQFRALLKYSPYHNVKPNVRYPALLMLGADSDDRVDPLHARKFVAEVQHQTTGSASTGAPIWLRVEKNSGHGGADLRKAEVEKNADRLAFALKYTQ